MCVLDKDDSTLPRTERSPVEDLGVGYSFLKSIVGRRASLSALGPAGKLQHEGNDRSLTHQ